MQYEQKDTLVFQKITKTFPGVVALDNVSFSIRGGEVHGLVGENGAGKSTLIKILCGVYSADGGTIEIDGKRVHIGSPSDAKKCGIQVMHQEISVLQNMTVAENIFMYDLPRRGGFTAEKEMNRRAREVLDQVGLTEIDSRSQVGSLSLAMQQMVNLARIVSTKPRIVLLDEPTASLTMNEVERLFEVINKYKESGVSIVYISHYLDEVLRICDRITVLRDGHYIETVESDDVTKEDVIEAMIGKRLQAKRHTSEALDENVLTMRNVSSPRVIRHVNLQLRKKEILGLYGLNGAGKTETIRAIMGLDKLFEGEIHLDGTPVQGKSISEITDAGIAYIPEDRRRQGLVLGMSVLENSTLGHERMFARGGFMCARAEAESAKKYVRAMKVKTPSLETTIGTLSGGNQQKVIMSRCIARKAKVYLLDEPTVGIDVGAREEIYQLISDIVSEGASVLVASSDLTEILEICDRIAIISHGTVVRVIDRDEATEEKLLLYAMGD